MAVAAHAIARAPAGHLDLDGPGAPVHELPHTRRARARAGEVQHRVAPQGQRAVVRHRVHSPMSGEWPPVGIIEQGSSPDKPRGEGRQRRPRAAPRRRSGPSQPSLTATPRRVSIDARSRADGQGRRRARRAVRQGSAVQQPRRQTRALRNVRRGEAPRGQPGLGVPGRLRAGRPGRGLGHRLRLARGDPLHPGALGDLRIAPGGQRHRRAHAPPAGGNGGPGPPPEPSPAHRRGGRHRRSHQRGPLRVRDRPQRRGALLRHLRRALRRESGPLPRGAGDHPAGLDGRAVQLRG